MERIEQLFAFPYGATVTVVEEFQVSSTVTIPVGATGKIASYRPDGVARIDIEGCIVFSLLCPEQYFEVDKSTIPSIPKEYLGMWSTICNLEDTVQTRLVKEQFEHILRVVTGDDLTSRDWATLYGICESCLGSGITSGWLSNQVQVVCSSCNDKKR